MNKEFFKSVTLSVLIFVALILTANIWFSKELWSNDYSSFMYSIKNFFNANNSNIQINTDEIIFKSQFSESFIAITKDSKRLISYAGKDDFSIFEGLLNTIKKEIKKEGIIVEASQEDLLNAHKSNSIMIFFHTNINLTSYFKENTALLEALKNPITQSILITLDTNQSAINYLYFYDHTTKKSYRLQIRYQPNKNLDKINQQISAKSASSSFAFELNFDKKKEGLDRILFDKFVPIELFPSSIIKLEATPILYKPQLKNPYDNIFKAFNITKNSARTYTDKNNIINFIENRYSLKIFKDGYFEIETNQNYEGLPINEVNELEGVIKFVNLLYKNITPDSNAILRLSSIESNKDINTYHFVYTTKNGSLYIKNNSAATVIVKNKKIISYKQQLLSVKITNATQNSTNLIKAYDQMYKTDIAKAKKNLTIKNMFPTNIYINNSSKIGWICEFSDGTIETILE